MPLVVRFKWVDDQWGVGHAALSQQGSAAKDDFYINAAEGPVEPQGKDILSKT